ncbi:Methyltransferase domain-containing protein [Pedococcus dokdonensis]|uniref:Methyltransferase domain-containing protein n=1 Tax=Pedococcus dokdonensis TaxID=443156 RepID=A0A1H0QZ08_9MICO|nr:class I SAM-dependent methyltransferase [Pedococcus dokdonensis]SDP22335.1 Methyltransferase domain-containing protein [Pedococcus dokdonensis]
MPTPLTITGERTAPGIWHENYWFRRHEAGYAAVPGWVPTAPSVVLDAGCGEGYAAGLIHGAWPAVLVVGVDYDAATTAHAARTHGGQRAAYLRGALTALPLPDGVVDVTVSLQVLEHIWTPGDYVRELARVTRPGGVVVVSTPNRRTFSPGLGRREKPANLYHCREYDAQELGEELVRWLPRAAVEVVGLGPGDRLTEWESAHGSVVTAQQATEPDQWPLGLREAVAAVTAADFVLGEPDDASLDLFAVLRLPPRNTAVASPSDRQ